MCAVMDGGADNSSPLIKPPSYRYDLRSKGLRMKYAVLAMIAAGLLVGCAASVRQVWAESPTGSAKYGAARKD